VARTYPGLVVVQAIIPYGKHGPYVVSTSENIEGSVTFSVDKPVWQEERWPERGEHVWVDDLTMKRAGWRAHRARFYRPDEH